VIPKTIHYFWFSQDGIPPSMRRCIDTWKRILPDYEIVKWDASTFNVDVNPFVANAFRARKWAFVTDYARLHALYECGGVYLDADVAVIRRFDELLQHDVVTAIEYHDQIVRRERTLELLNPDGSSRQTFTRKPGIGIQAAIIAGRKGHPFFRDCMEQYLDRPFLLENGKYIDPVIAPDIYAMVAERYGFKYRDERQLLSGNILIVPSHIFAGKADQATRKSYAIHLCEGSWRAPDGAGGQIRLTAVLRRAAKFVMRTIRSGLRNSLLSMGK